MERPPVIVIGAGVSGLTAIKACLEENLPVICFESTNSIGGVWKYRKNGMSVMKSTYQNSSKEWNAFSDFPCPEEYPNYLSNELYMEYLTMYAKKFNLSKYIRLEHEVLWISKKKDYEEIGQWTVKVRSKENVEENIVASAIMMCVGAFHDPYVPSFTGLENFKGIVMHSKDYKTPFGMEGKRVVVIGSGNTAGDAAVEIGRVASKLYLVIRRGILLVSRIGKQGLPLDMMRLSRFAAWKSANLQSESTTAKLISEGPSLQVDKNLYNLQMDGFLFAGNINLINDELPLSIMKGSVIIKNQVHKFTEDGVIFQGEENEKYPLDVVILATGYQLSMRNILDEKAVSRQDLIKGLYKRVFPVNLTHPTMAFIGCCLKFNGSNFQASELQSRWAAQIFAGKLNLPSTKIMTKDLKNYEKLLEKTNSGQSYAVVNYYPYIDDLANEFGAKPNLFQLLHDPKLFWAVAFGPCVAYHFRLNGPHPWSGARGAILTVQDRIRAPFKTRPDVSSMSIIDRKSKLNFLIFFTSVAMGTMYFVNYLNYFTSF